MRLLSCSIPCSVAFMPHTTPLRWVKHFSCTSHALLKLFHSLFSCCSFSFSKHIDSCLSLHFKGILGLLLTCLLSVLRHPAVHMLSSLMPVHLCRLVRCSVQTLFTSSRAMQPDIAMYVMCRKLMKPPTWERSGRSLFWMCVTSTSSLLRYRSFLHCVIEH